MEEKHIESSVTNARVVVSNYILTRVLLSPTSNVPEALIYHLTVYEIWLDNWNDESSIKGKPSRMYRTSRQGNLKGWEVRTGWWFLTIVGVDKRRTDVSKDLKCSCNFNWILRHSAFSLVKADWNAPAAGGLDRGLILQLHSALLTGCVKWKGKRNFFMFQVLFLKLHAGLF